MDEKHELLDLQRIIVNKKEYTPNKKNAKH